MSDFTDTTLAPEGDDDLNVPETLPVPVAFGIDVHAAPHPFRMAQRIDKRFPLGSTLKDIMEEIQPDPFLRDMCHVHIDGVPVPIENWGVVRPKHGTNTYVCAVPQGGGGGGGKNPLRVILTLAVIVAAFTLGGPLGASLVGQAGVSAFGFTITAQAIGGAIISAIGTLIVNAIAPIRPAQLSNLTGNKQESPTLAISGASNQASPFGVLPCILGRNKVTPPYAALPFTEIVGNDQYLRCVFVWGYGPLKIEDIKIGDTPIENFSDVEIVTRAGFSTDAGLSLFTQDVSEQNLSVLVTSAAGSITRATQSDGDEVSVDFSFVRGLTSYTDGGARTNRTVVFTVEYAPVGSSTWVGGDVVALTQNSPTIADVSNTHSVVMADGTTMTITSASAERIDVVVLDRWSGVVQVITGVVAYDGDAPVQPVVPATKVALAAIHRTSAAGTITSGQITDLRDSTSPFTTPATDFLVTAQASPNDTVRIAAGTLTGAKTQTVTKSTAESYYLSVRFAVPTRGKYQIRVTRVTADSTSDRTIDELTWGILRTFTYEEPFDPTGLATTEVRIRATDQLNSVISQFTGIVTSIVPDWDSGSGTWYARPTQNPASIARWVFQGPANARPMADSRMRLDPTYEAAGSFEYFWNYCDTNSFTFNMVRDFQSSVFETLIDVCSGAFASPAQPDGQWGIIIDEDKTVPAQHFTPINSWNFSFTRTYPTRPHGLRLRFVNELNGFVQDERIVYDDGYSAANATLFESMDVTGVTHPDQIYIVGRRRIAEARLRCESYMFNTDFENLMCTRGDLVLLSHDIISQGLGAGRIKTITLNGSGNAISMTTTTGFDMELGHRYGVVIRNADYGKITSELTVVAGLDQKSFTFKTPIVAPNIPAVGDLFSYGVFENETLEVLVQAVTPIDDMAATLKVVPLARPIFSSSEGPIPEFSPNISVDAGYITPFIAAIRSDESVLTVLPSGILVPTIRLTFGRYSSALINRPLGIEIQYKGSTDIAWKSMVLMKQELTQADITNVEQGTEYSIQIRYILTVGVGPWSPTYTHTVVGMSTLPDDPTDLVLEGDYLRWLYTPPLDFSGFEVRTSTDTTSSWDLMDLAHDGLVKQAELNITNFARGERIFAVKAVDIAGNYSSGMASFTYNFGITFTELVVNVLSTVDFKTSGWTGTLTGGIIDGSNNLAADDLTTYLPTDGALYLTDGASLYLPNQFDTMVYTSNPFIMAASLYPSRLTVKETHVGGLVVSYRYGDDALYLPNGSDLYVNGTANSALYLPPDWTIGFRPFPAYVDTIGGRVYQFKATLDGGQDATELSELKAIFDTDDISENIAGTVLAGVTGTRLTLTKTYRSVKMVSVTLRSGSTAVKVEVVDFSATLGPLLQAVNAAGTVVAATVDVQVIGVKG